MDQDTTKGSDKRNWRERLGIGTAGNGAVNKELPRISDDFRKEAPVPASARPASASPRPVTAGAKPVTAVRPAPMAPRPAPRPAALQPIPPDKLADRLRAQRDASAKLAEQRVQIAKQRSDQPPAAPTTAAPTPQVRPATAKPKFSFAEDDGPVVPQVQQGVVPPPPPVNMQRSAPPPMPRAAAAAAPQQQPLTPARPPLGTNPAAMPPRPQQPFQQAQQPIIPPRGPAAPPPAFPPGYGQQPPAYQPQYRPIDPATGYAPPPQAPYIPQSYSPALQPGYPAQPRLNMPPRTGYQPQGDYGSQGGYSADGRGGPRLSSRTVQRMPSPAGYEEQDEGEVFEEPVRGRRPSSGDYQQAYREAEADYDDDVPRSKGPWILLGLLLFAVAIAGMSVWYYQKNIKPMMATQSGATEQQVPVVEPPAQAAKAQPEQAPAETPAAQAKKQIYDRIVGDREVTGGQMVPTEETPAAPADGASSIPQPAGDAQPTGVQNGGEEAAPLPIPPPPGDANTQGSLQTTVPEKTAQISTPAAGESQAAVAAPAPGELAPSQVASAPQPPAAPEPQAAQESIADPTPAAEEPVVEKKITTAKPKAVAAKKPATSLGSKPVVLVPPAKKPAAPAVDTEVATLDAPNAQSTGGLYGGQDVTAPVAGAPAAATPAAPRKKRTIADLFNGTSNDENAITQQAPAPQVAAPAPAPAPVAKAAPVAPKATQPVPAAPAPVQTATTGGFMVQLASFRTKEEASSEFARLKAKYGGVFSGYSPIINEALVGGSTRYRLAVGTMPSRDQANAMCSKLFAAGERDCLVRNR